MFGQCRTISRPTMFPPVEHRPTTKVGTKPITSVVNEVKPRAASIPSVRELPRATATTGTSFSNAAMVPGVAFATGRSITMTNIFNAQTNSYVSTLTTEQARLTQSNDAFLRQTYASNQNPTITQLRNKGDWGAVKRLVIRDELMKIQIGGKTDLPLSDAQFADLAKRIKGLDLSNMSDARINSIISDILRPSDQVYLDALKAFKATGKVDSCFQASKIEQLSEYLKDIDLGKITAKELKYIKDNYIEKPEIHHRTSISSDPTQQSNIDNLDTLNTTQHDAKHTDPDTNKIDYRRRLNEAPLDRKGELKSLNRKRVIKENLAGLGVAVAIGFGTGFAIGFIVSLAQNGINPNSMKYAFAAGAKQGTTSGVMAAGSFAIGKTVGAALSKTLTESIKSWVGTNATEATMKKIAEICDMGAVGAIVTVAFAVYEFCKLKHAGYSTKESLLRAGKSAALSFSILIISMVAVWAGAPGLVVSIVAGVVMTGFSVAKVFHDKKISKEVTHYSIELCIPNLQPA